MLKTFSAYKIHNVQLCTDDQFCNGLEVCVRACVRACVRVCDNQREYRLNTEEKLIQMFVRESEVKTKLMIVWRACCVI